MKKTLFTLALVAVASCSLAQNLYVNSGDSYRSYPLGEVGDMRCQNDQLQLADTALDINSLDSLTFSSREPAYQFLPAEMIESVSSAGRVTTRVPLFQDAESNAKLGPLRISRWTEQADGSFRFVEHPIVSTVKIDLSGLKERGKIKEVILSSAAGEDIAEPLTYSTAQNIDWLKKPQATGTLTYKSGTTTYATSLKSDVVILQNIPEGATEVTAYILPAKLTNGLITSIVYEDGTPLSQNTQAETTTTASSTAVTLNVALTDAQATLQNRWMARIPGSTKYNMLSIPGTHDAATASVSSGYSSMAQTQSLSIAEQLEAGVRAFDFRPRYNASSQSDIELDNLEIYHGLVSTGIKWKDAMNTLVNFVTENPTEAIFVNMQKEDASGSTDYSSTWRTSIRTWLQQNKTHVVQKITATMTLGDVRGKVCVVSHNPYGSDGVYNDIVYGGLVSWQDNTGFDTQINYTSGTKVVDATVEDSYNASNDDKVSKAKALFTKSSADTSNRWYYTFTNVAWSLFGSSIQSHAKAVNPAISEAINGGEYSGRLGLIFMDYAADATYQGDALLQSIINQNSKYVYEGR